MELNRYSKESNYEFVNNLYRLREVGSFCDLDIEAEGIIFKTHKHVMAANRCRYFQDILADDRVDRIVVDNVSAEVLAEIIKFCYTSKIGLTGDNLVAIYKAASDLDHQDLQETCIRFLGWDLRSENCVYYMKMSHKYNLPKLHDICYNFCEDNFKMILHLDKDDLLDLDGDDLASLIKSDYAYAREIKIYHLILDWIARSPEARQHMFEMLISLVRFSQISDRELHEIANSELARESEHLRRCVEDGFQFKVCPDKFGDRPQFRRREEYGRW